MDIITPGALKRLRKFRKETQSEFGRLINVSPAIVSYWEAGKYPIPEKKVPDIMLMMAQADKDKKQVEGRDKLRIDLLISCARMTALYFAELPTDEQRRYIATLLESV